MKRRSERQFITTGLLLLMTAALIFYPATGNAAGLIKDKDIEMNVWSRAVFNVHYDSDDIRGNTDFATYLTGEGGEEINFNPRDTRFGFSAATSENDWKYSCIFEIDFYGGNAGNNLLPRLRLGYAEAKNNSGFSFRAGQDWVPIAQQNPGTLDFGILSWGGNLWWRVPQLTARYKTGNFELLGGLMKHRVSSDQENQEKMPWALSRIAWNGLANGKGTVAFNAGYRSVNVGGADYKPWIMVAELKLPLGPKVTLKSEAWTGVGVGREFVRYGLDYNTATEDGISSQGGFASLGIVANPKTSFAFGYGIDDPKDEDLEGSAAPFASNAVAFANVKHKISKNYGVGLEIMNFSTEALDGSSMSGQRFTTSYWFIF